MAGSDFYLTDFQVTGIQQPGKFPQQPVAGQFGPVGQRQVFRFSGFKDSFEIIRHRFGAGEQICVIQR